MRLRKVGVQRDVLRAPEQGVEHPGTSASSRPLSSRWLRARATGASEMRTDVLLFEALDIEAGSSPPYGCRSACAPAITAAGRTVRELKPKFPLIPAKAETQAFSKAWRTEKDSKVWNRARTNNETWVPAFAGMERIY